MTLYTLHHIIGYTLFVVMGGLISTGLIHKFIKKDAMHLPLRIKAKKTHIILAYILIGLWAIQLLTVIL